jgi:ABC-2 type transport system ATP-binding protein
MTTTYAVLSEGLEKSFKDVRALRGLDLAVAEGTVCGLLGPNGAGKTTAVRLLTTLLRPDAGSARVAGHDLVREPDAVRRAIGVTGQYASVDGDLTGRENLRLFAKLRRLPKAPPAPTNSSTASNSPTRRTAPRPPTPAACGGASTWPRA